MRFETFNLPEVAVGQQPVLFSKLHLALTWKA